MCLRSAGNRVTIFGEECTSQWGQSNLPVPGPAAIVCDSSKEKRKDKFASLKPLQTWNFLPPCSVLVLDMDVASPAPSCSLVWQQFDSCHTSTDCWIMEGITSTPTGALGTVLTQERGLGSALAQRCLQLLHRVWHLGQVMLIPHLQQHPALGTRSEDKQDSISRCPLLHTCHLFCARGGGARTPGGESMAQSVPLLPAMQWKQSNA